MWFSHDNNVVTTLLSHHCCNSLLTSSNNSEHDHSCSIDTNFPCSNSHEQPLYESSSLNNIVETLLDNIAGPTMLLLMRDNNIVQALFRQQLCNTHGETDRLAEHLRSLIKNNDVGHACRQTF